MQFAPCPCSFFGAGDDLAYYSYRVVIQSLDFVSFPSDLVAADSLDSLFGMFFFPFLSFLHFLVGTALVAAQLEVGSTVRIVGSVVINKKLIFKQFVSLTVQCIDRRR